jgi:hypothetical protein
MPIARWSGRTAVPRAIGALLALMVAGSAESRTFQEILGTPVTEKIGDSLAQSVGRALPLVSASSGLVYTFDPATGAFERETSILGQLFLERADPIGRRHLSVNLSYQYVEIETFEGKDIDALEDTSDPIVDPRSGELVTVPLFGIDLETHMVTASLTYGLTEDADVNIAVPLLYSEFERRVIIQGPSRVADDDSADKLGIGDIFLRAKYRLLKSRSLHVAGGLVLRLPTGNDENFQGTGDTELALMSYASVPAWQPLPRLRLEPYLNAGYDFDCAEISRSEARWGLGVDVGFSEHLTGAVAVLGRHAVDRLVPAGFFSFERADGQSEPLFGLQGDRPDIYNLSVGGRINVFRDTVFVLLNVVVPLNEDGVQAGATPLVGVEATF